MDQSFGTLALLLAVGLVIGVVGGMLGIGGAILVIPVLVQLFHFPQERAIGTSLAMLLPPIGIFAFLDYYRHGNVDIRAAAVMAAAFAIGALLGARVVNAQLIPRDTLRLFFAFFLLYVAGNIIFLRGDQRVWAMVKTIMMVVGVGITYLALLLIGRRMERRMNLRQTFMSGLTAPRPPDYEI